MILIQELQVLKLHIYNVETYYGNVNSLKYKGKIIKELELHDINDIEPYLTSFTYKLLMDKLDDYIPTFEDTIKLLKTEDGYKLFSEIISKELVDDILNDITDKDDTMTFAERYSIT